MFVKQIDEKEALRLYQDGVDVKIMYPSLTGSGDLDWMGMEHDTLQAMLDRCMFFRTEPAAVDSDFEMVFQEREENPPPNADGTVAEPAGGTKKLSGKRVSAGAKRKPVDTGRIMALHNAGWSNVKIADDMGISDVTVGKYLKQMLGEKN